MRSSTPSRVPNTNSRSAGLSGVVSRCSALMRAISSALGFRSIMAEDPRYSNLRISNRPPYRHLIHHGAAAMAAIDPLTATGVLLATAATDAVYVMFTSAVVARKRVPAATWSSVWYLLSSYAVISYTENWIYVAFAAIGSWLGAFATITFLHRPPGGPPVGAAPE